MYSSYLVFTKDISNCSQSEMSLNCRSSGFRCYDRCFQTNRGGGAKYYKVRNIMVLRGCKLTWLKTNSFFYYYFNETIKKSPNKNQNSKYSKSFIVHFPGHQVLSRSFDKDHQRELGWGLVNPNE